MILQRIDSWIKSAFRDHPAKEAEQTILDQGALRSEGDSEREEYPYGDDMYSSPISEFDTVITVIECLESPNHQAYDLSKSAKRRAARIIYHSLVSVEENEYGEKEAEILNRNPERIVSKLSFDRPYSNSQETVRRLCKLHSSYRDCENEFAHSKKGFRTSPSPSEYTLGILTQFVHLHIPEASKYVQEVAAELDDPKTDNSYKMAIDLLGALQIEAGDHNQILNQIIEIARDTSIESHIRVRAVDALGGNIHLYKAEQEVLSLAKARPTDVGPDVVDTAEYVKEELIDD